MPLPIDPALRLSLTNDFVFKAVLASSDEVLIALLSAVLQPSVPIESVTILNPELPRDFEDDKGGFLDVSVQLHDGTRLDVEMQASQKHSFRPRALFYWARLFASQLSSGRDHARLSRTISVLFLDYREFEFGQFHEIFRIQGEQTGAGFSPLLELHTIELPKLGRALPSLHSSDRALVRWCRYLATKDPQEIEQLVSEDPMIEKAEEKVAKVSTDPQLRELALERERRQIAWQLERTAAWDEGIAEGRAQGREEGQRQLLEEQLQEAFGPLAEKIRERVRSANSVDLTRWAKRLLKATTLDEVFG